MCIKPVIFTDCLSISMSRNSRENIHSFFFLFFSFFHVLGFCGVLYYSKDMCGSLDSLILTWLISSFNSVVLLCFLMWYPQDNHVEYLKSVLQHD